MKIFDNKFNKPKSEKTPKHELKLDNAIKTKLQTDNTMKTSLQIEKTTQIEFQKEKAAKCELQKNKKVKLEPQLNVKFNFKKSDNVVVGVSGGADSMTLLFLLHKEQVKVGFGLFAVHVNHHIRGKESDRDQKTVENFCAKQGINLTVFNVDCLNVQKNSGESLETVARRLRYNCFYHVLKEVNANYLVLAHHKNDQAETILMNLARGTGVKGAIGIKETYIETQNVGEDANFKEICKKVRILRPFLQISRKEIEEFASDFKIPYEQDSTNKDCNITRNYIRNVIFPAIEKNYPRVQDNLCLFANILKEDEDYFNSILPKDKVEIKHDCVVFDKSILNEPRPICIRTLKFGLDALGFSTDLGQVHYEAILKMKELKSGAKIDLPHNLEGRIDYDKLKIIPKNYEKNTDCLDFEVGEMTFLNRKIKSKVVTCDEVNFNLNCKFIDFDKVPAGAVVRTRRPKDMFAKLGTGSKKLNDYFTDKKIPQQERDKLPLLASGNTVLYVFGLDISEKVKIDANTERVLAIEYF